MKCEKCDDKGFYDAPLMLNANNMGSLKQCCDIKKYSAEVKRRIEIDREMREGPRPLAKVLPLRKKEK